MEARGARPRSMRLTDDLDVAAALATDLWLRPAPSRAFRASRPMSTSSSRERRLPRSPGPSLDATRRSWRETLIRGCTQPSRRSATSGRSATSRRSATLPVGPLRRPTPATLPGALTRVCTGWPQRPPTKQRGAAWCHGMRGVTAIRLFRSPDARRSRAVHPRRSQWSPGAHALAPGTQWAAPTPGPTPPPVRLPERPAAPADPGPRPIAPAATSAAPPARGPGTWPTRQRARPVPP